MKYILVIPMALFLLLACVEAILAQNVEDSKETFDIARIDGATPLNPIDCNIVRQINGDIDHTDGFCEKLCFFSIDSNPLQMVESQNFFRNFNCSANVPGVSCEREVGGLVLTEVFGSKGSPADQSMLGRVDKRGFTWRADRDSSWYLRWRPAWHET